MNLVHDYIAPTPAGGHCRIRLYLPEESKDSPIVICTEPAEDNPGMSITNCAEVVAARVIQANGIDVPIWVEHYEDGARGTKEDPHTFDLVTFASYEPMSFKDIDGWSMRLGRPRWKALDRTTVESLVEQEVR